MPRNILPRTMTHCRRLVATSHDRKYGYYLDARDLYVYQWSVAEAKWIGWLCALSVWDATFSKSGSYQLEVANAA